MTSRIHHQRLRRPQDYLYEITELKPGDHLCCIYRNDKEHRAVITPFIVAGLQRNEKVFYITDERTAKKIINYFADQALNINSYIEKGQFLILTAHDAYLKDDVFDPAKMIELLKKETRDALKSGYSALRVTGEMTWALRGHPGSERLIEYETKLNEFFPKYKSLAVCQYDMRRFKADILLDVLRTHPLAIIGTEVYSNFYYIPPHELLSPQLNEAKLKHWLENLRNYNQYEALSKEADRMFDTLLQNLPGFVYRCKNDRDWTMEEISDGVKPILGYTPEEIKSNSYAEMIHPDDRENVWNNIQQALDRRLPFRINYRMRTKAGDYRWMLEQGCGIFHKDDALRYLEGFVTDIDEEVKAREDRDRFFNLSSDLICFAGADGYFKYVNPVWEQVLGYTEKELLSKPFLNFIHPDDHQKNEAEVYQLLSGEKTVGYENRYLHKDGTFRIINWTATPVPEKRIYYCIGRDVTEERQTQKILFENEERLRKAQEAGKIGTWELDIKTGICTVSEEFARIHGIQPGKVEMEKIRSLIPEHDIELVEKAYQRTLNEHVPYIVDHRIKKPGTTKVQWVQAKGELVLDSKQHSVKMVGTSQDITDQKLVNIELKQEKERAQNYLDIAGVLFMVLNEKQTVTLINKKGCEILGYSEEEIIGKNWFDTFLPEDEVEDVKAVFNKLLTGELEAVEYYENSILAKDGKKRVIAWHNTMLRDESGKITGLLSSGEDITERVEIASEIEKKNKLLTEMGKTAKIAGWEHDLKTGKAVWTDTLYDIIEILPSEEPPGVNEHLDFYPPRDRAILEKAYNRAIDEHRSFDLDLNVYTATKRLLWCHVYGEPVVEDGTCIKMRGVFQDITERQKIKESLKLSENKYKLLAEHAKDVIWTMDAQGKFLYVSPSVERLRGYTAEEVMKQSLDEILSPDGVETIQNAMHLFREQQQKGIRDTSPKTYEVEQPCKDGSSVWTEVVTNNIYDKDGNFMFILGVSRDITDRKKAEQELRLSEERFRKIVEHMPVLINANDENRNFIFWNKECEKVTGYSANEIINNPDATKMLYPEKNQHDSMMAEWAERGNSFENWELTLTTKDGKKRTVAWFNLSSSIKIPGWYSWAVGFDVTDRNNAKKDVEKKINELEKFNKLMVGRENRMIELKKEINRLLEKLDKPKKYQAPEKIE